MEKAALPLLVFVETDTADADLSLRAVKDSGIECEVAIVRNEVALKIVLEVGEEIPRLFVLECRSTEIDPYLVLRAIRDNERMRNVPVLIHANTDSRTDAVKLQMNGANSCLDKPDSSDAFIDRLSSAIRYWLKFNLDVRPPQPRPWS